MVVEDPSTTCYIHTTLCFCNFCIIHFRITLSYSMTNSPEILVNFIQRRIDKVIEYNILINLFKSFSLSLLHKVLIHLFLDKCLDFSCILLKVTICYNCSCSDYTCFFPTTLLNSPYSNIDVFYCLLYLL